MMPYELTPQDKDVLSDYPDWVPPKVPPPGCPCNRYTSCKECVEATTTPCPFKPCDTCESICEMRLQEHDEKIRQDATEKALVKILEKCNVECDTDTGQILAYQNISLDEVLDIFDSLRTKPKTKQGRVNE